MSTGMICLLVWTVLRVPQSEAAQKQYAGTKRPPRVLQRRKRSLNSMGWEREWPAFQLPVLRSIDSLLARLPALIRRIDEPTIELPGL